MSGYTKLFSSILASTVWREPNHVRILWITLLAMADKHGYVEGSIPGIADFARITLPECEEALQVLQNPDSYSRSQDHEGRRIEARDGGWIILNHGKYRAKLNADERREYNRVKQAEHRQKKRQQVSNTSLMVIEQSALSAQAEAEAEAEAEADTEAEATTEAKSRSRKELVCSSADADFTRFYEAYPEGRRISGKKGRTAFKNALKDKPHGFLDTLLSALAQHKQSKQWKVDQVVPLMTTWLNQERWNQRLPGAKPTDLKGSEGMQAAGNAFLRQRG